MQRDGVRGRLPGGGEQRVRVLLQQGDRVVGDRVAEQADPQRGLLVVRARVLVDVDTVIEVRLKRQELLTRPDAPLLDFVVETNDDP